MDFVLLAQDIAVAEASGAKNLFDTVVSPTGRVLLGAAVMVVGIFLLLPPRGRGKQFLVGSILTSLAVVFFLLPTLAELPSAPAFFLLEGLAVLGGLGMVTSRSPVYSAIWFASSLLAIGAILLIGGAQFLGVATVAVYAGAIVVTFLFVLMLAQPEGHAVYDRLGWGWFPALCATLAGVSLVAIMAAGLVPANGGELVEPTELRSIVTEAIAAVRSQSASGETRGMIPVDVDPTLPAVRRSDEKRLLHDVQWAIDPSGNPALHVTLIPDSGLLAGGVAVLATAIRSAAKDSINQTTQILIHEQDILADEHVAKLGGELFGRHLISIQVAGVLLMVALVAAIAMAIHGKDLPVGAARKGVMLR